MEYWKTLRGNYRRSVVKIGKWTKHPSGSAAQKGKKPRPYKYAAELSFLHDIFSLQETNDSMSTSQMVSDPSETEDDDDTNDQVLYFRNITKK